MNPSKSPCEISCEMILQKFTREGNGNARNGQYFTPNKIDGKRKNPETFVASGFPVWCGRWDLNPYVIQHTPLKRACLPIPALPHIHFVHQRCNVYIIRNPAGFVNPFFEKSFLRAAGTGCGGRRTPATFIHPWFFPSRCRRRAAPRRAPAAAAAARVRRAAPRFPKSKAIR